ncbi:NPCBM/NEW2 domain-containing protein [Paenibacillus jiagnxiensis]|uniref:NPCBM/NEW2 domain-containing protein n=1 Tax=Paenibacillus jiagnxiensis TaxID=3228926 RepID=UPI0033A52E78
MKDTLKGVVIGIFIGSLVAGSATAFASNNVKLSVVLENVKYIFHGVEKKTTQSIVYNGQLYAPVKEIANGIGESFTYDGKTKTGWVGQKEGSYVYLDEISYARTDGKKDNLFFKNWKNPSGLKFTIAGQKYLHGIGSVLYGSKYSQYFNSVDYNLNGKYKRLSGFAGIDDYTKNSDSTGAIVIKGDGQELFRKEGMRGGDLPFEINVDVTGVLKLQVYFETSSESYDQIDIVFTESKLY